jgi:hypothetical protein
MVASMPTQDYTIRNGLGIRVNDRETCQVIRKQRQVWKEIGRVYELPLAEEELRWSATDIPASVIAVALRAYELDHPDSELREMLTEKAMAAC